MLRSRSALLLLLLAMILIGYRWLGIIMSCGVALLVFVLYEFFIPPPRHRIFGPGQSQEAVDNDFGHFGRAYREDAPPEEASPKVSRNDPCPCGSGLKFKRCCGRTRN